MNLDTPIEFIKGIGPEKSKLIKNVLNISVAEDFLYLYPIRYIDRSRIAKIEEIRNDENTEIQLLGKISNLRELGEGKRKRLVAQFSDNTGTMDLVWFKYTPWMIEQIPINRNVILFGKVGLFNQVFSMSHPEIELYNPDNIRKIKILPVYPSSEKLTKRQLNQKFFRGILKNICTEIPNLISENLPEYLVSSLKLMSRQEAFANIHFPESIKHYQKAEERLKFEEAFFFQLSYGLKKKHKQKNTLGNPMPSIGNHFNHFYNEILPFELTHAQKRVLREIHRDMKRSTQMNRLLQGDVGSGKTMVALLSALLALDNGFQSCILAPTEILAQQHFFGIADLLKNTGIKVELLTGSSKASERKTIHEELQNGKISILIGTHAILEDIVKFKNLGLAIIDEQHRFGVAQRAKLWTKNTIPPHVLIMTATPIPRTLAMSYYSDLDISVIDELPAGRKPIITAHRRELNRDSVSIFIKEELKKGRQIYFVYPLIEESEALDYNNLMEGFEMVSNTFKGYNITMVHGKMKPQEKEENMQYFASGKAQIMVATTVIEVGVNVPNASVMVIESAERFGLSQLHQLRGRVGRGAEQSYCILMTSDKLSSDSRTRIKTMVETTDGFRISEVDMQLRGPGNILGTQQSGVVEFKKLSLVHDGNIIKYAKKCITQLLEKDPLLAFHEHKNLKDYYLKHFKMQNKWSRIS